MIKRCYQYAIYFVLDYNLWRMINMLQSKLDMGIRWRKVNSYITIRTYKPGQEPVGDKSSI